MFPNSGGIGPVSLLPCKYLRGISHRDIKIKLKSVHEINSSAKTSRQLTICRCKIDCLVLVEWPQSIHFHSDPWKVNSSMCIVMMPQQQYITATVLLIDLGKFVSKELSYIKKKNCLSDHPQFFYPSPWTNNSQLYIFCKKIYYHAESKKK